MWSILADLLHSIDRAPRCEDLHTEGRATAARVATAQN